MRHAMLFAVMLAIAGCATAVHGPFQDVRIDSVPSGATVTVSPMASQRGPLFIDERKTQTLTTPATVRLKRDNDYRIEIQKEGYKIATGQISSSYDWVWAPIACGPCEAIAQLPTYDMKDHILPVRFLEAAFYEYPKGFFRAVGQVSRLASPDALLGNAFKLKEKDSGYWSNWTGLGTPEVVRTLEPAS